MHKCLVEKDEHIVKLQDKVKQLESNQENVEKLQMLMGKVSNLEALNIEKTQVTFRCEKCPFVSSSEKGLKTHLTRKHTIISATGYPRKCELCNKQFNNPNDFKKHMKSHSYKEAKFKCEDCDFVGKCAETMDVHMGKTHTDSFKFSLCENSFENLKNLA